MLFFKKYDILLFARAIISEMSPASRGEGSAAGRAGERAESAREIAVIGEAALARTLACPAGVVGLCCAPRMFRRAVEQTSAMGASGQSRWSWKRRGEYSSDCSAVHPVTGEKRRASADIDIHFYFLPSERRSPFDGPLVSTAYSAPGI